MDPEVRSSSAQTPDLARVADERRCHPRYLDEVKVRFRDLEGYEPSAWGRTRDLSLGGLCLLTEGEIAVGTHLAIEVHIEDELAPVLALGRVLRCEEDEFGRASGIQFLWVSEEDRSNLYRLADYFRKTYGE
jgi:hypothetical protein